MKIYKKYFRYIIMAFLLFISGCLVVKEPEYQDVMPVLALSPKPEVPMSDELIRTKPGDMIATLPKDWFLVDVTDKASSEIFAVAVNPDYTLSAVFSFYKKSDQIDKIIEKEGLLGLARLSLAKHQKKTAGAVKQVGKYVPIEMGANNFVQYEFSSTGGALVSKVVVFKSSLNQYYEFSLVPMNITGRQLPDSEETNKIFRSIVSTIKF